MTDYMDYTRTEKRRLVRKHRFFRHWATFLASCIFLATSFVLFGSRVIWPGNEWWDVYPSFKESLNKILGAFFIPVIYYIFKKYYPEKVAKFDKYVRRLWRNGLLTILFAAAAVVFFLLSAFITPRDPFAIIYRYLEGPVVMLESAEKAYNEVIKKPKYKESPDALIIGLIIKYRKCHNEWDQAARSNFFIEVSSAIQNVTDFHKGWMDILIGDCLYENEEIDKSLEHYKAALQNSAARPYVKAYACKKIAFYYYKNTEWNTAIEYWNRTVKELENSEIAAETLQNMARYNQNNGFYKTALEQYDKAALIFERLKMDSFYKTISQSQKESVLFLNISNCYSEMAHATTAVNEAASNKSYDYLERARKLDKCYLDIYWTGIQMDLRNKSYPDALGRLAEVNILLEDQECVKSSKYKDFHYGAFGHQLTSWLELKLHFMQVKPPRRIPRNIVENMKRYFPGIAYNPLQVIKRKLGEINDTGYNIDNEDYSILQKMQMQGYLRFQ